MKLQATRLGVYYDVAIVLECMEATFSCLDEDDDVGHSFHSLFDLVHRKALIENKFDEACDMYLLDAPFRKEGVLSVTVDE